MNDDIPTPRTDDAQFGTGRVSVEFARTLERELTEARNQRDNALAALRMLCEAADVYAADQSGSTDERIGLVQPFSAEDGRMLNEALVVGWKILESGTQDARMPELERALDDAEVRAERWAHRCREAESAYDGLAALVGTVRSMVPVPVRNVKDITPEEHSREIGDAIDTLREQRDRLAEALRSLASGVGDGWFSNGEWWEAGYQEALAALKEGGPQ